MATLVQSDSRQRPPNHTLEDVAEEMLNGILCHYEPPPDRSHEQQMQQLQQNNNNNSAGHHHGQQEAFVTSPTTKMTIRLGRDKLASTQQQQQMQQRRGILRAPKAWTRRNGGNSKSGRGGAGSRNHQHHHHPFQLQASSSSTSKSVRWSDTHSSEDDDEDDDDVNVKPSSKSSSKKNKKDDSNVKAARKFPVEIGGCNLSGTCTEVGIEAGCLSPSVEAFVYDDDKNNNTNSKDDADEIIQAGSGNSKADKKKLLAGKKKKKDGKKAAGRVGSSEGDEEVEDDGGDDPPPPPPPPYGKKRMPLQATPAPKAKRSSRRYAEEDDDDVMEDDPDWDGDEQEGKQAITSKSSRRSATVPTTTGKAGKSKGSSSSSSNHAAKRYHRPHQEYDTTHYDDDLNNSILDEDATDFIGEDFEEKPKSAGGGRPRKPTAKSTARGDRDETGSAVSNTSSLFQRIWRRGSTDNGSSRRLVDSDDAVNQRFGIVRGSGNKAAPQRSRSASPYRRRSSSDKDAVEQLRDLSPMNQSPSNEASGRGGFLRSVIPSPKRLSKSGDSDWDESIPIVRTGRRSDARSMGVQSKPRRPSRSESPHSRGRSASLDRMEARGRSSNPPPPARNSSSNLQPQRQQQQPQQAPTPVWNYGPPPPTQKAASYYHPAHPLVNRQPVRREMEQQSLITAHRRGFDMESDAGSARMRMEVPPPLPPPSFSAYQNSDFDRQSYITAHRQGFDSGSEFDRQSYIMAQQQGFNEPPAATVGYVVPAARQPPPPPPPPPLPPVRPPQAQVQQPMTQAMYAQRATGSFGHQPQQYQRPVSTQPRGRTTPVRGRSVSPAHAANVPRVGRSPSPSRNVARQRAQSPTFPSRAMTTSQRRHSFEPQHQAVSYAPQPNTPPQRLLPPPPPAQFQPPPQQMMQPQKQRESGPAIEAYPPTRSELEYQQSYLMMQRPEVPRQPAPNSMVQYGEVPMQFQPSPYDSHPPPRAALKPVSSRQATPGKPRRKGFLASLKKTGGRGSIGGQNQAIAMPTMQYQPMPQATPPASSPVFLPEVGLSVPPSQQTPSSIPSVLPKTKAPAAESDTNQTIVSDPLSVHDPNCPPAVSQLLGTGGETNQSNHDPVSAYGTKWQANGNAGCNVLGAVWDNNKAVSTANGNGGPVDGVGQSAAARNLVIEPVVESQQAQGEATSESNPSPDVELSWEERTRQAWERIRSGLIVFGDPQETSSEALSPCCSESGTAKKAKASEVQQESRPEPVLLPAVSSQKPRESEVTGVSLPANRSVMNPDTSTQARQQLYMTGPYDPSKPHGILKQPSYDRRVTFGEPTEQFYDDAADETESYCTELTAKRRRVFRGRKVLSAFFGRGLSKANKLQDSGLPHLNTRSTEASSVTGGGSVSQEWDGGAPQNYYKSHLVEGSGYDPREPTSGAHNLTCHAGLSYQ